MPLLLETVALPIQDIVKSTAILHQSVGMTILADAVVIARV